MRQSANWRRSIAAALLGAHAAWCAPGCRGVLDIEDTVFQPAECDLFPQRIFFADKPTSDTTVVVGALSTGRFEELAASLEVTLDPNLGHVIAEVTDCVGEAAEDARVDFDGSGSVAVAFSTAGNRLTESQATSVEGLRGVFNADINEVAVTSRPNEIEVPSSQGDVEVRPGELSRIQLAPNSEVTELVESPPTEDEWDCVGTLEEPSTSRSRITLEIEVQQARTFVAGGTPLEGIQIAVCLDDAARCEVSAPAADGLGGTTDAEGRLELEVPVEEDGFDGHLIVTGHIHGCEPT